MRWFGRRWSPVCATLEAAAVPIDEACGFCEEPIAATDEGMLIPHFGSDGVGRLPWHANCWVRVLFGGINHLRGTCRCGGGNDPPDPPGLSRREAADLAAQHVRRQPLPTRFSCG